MSICGGMEVRSLRDRFKLRNNGRKKTSLGIDFNLLPERSNVCNDESESIDSEGGQK